MRHYIYQLLLFARHNVRDKALVKQELKHILVVATINLIFFCASILLFIRDQFYGDIHKHWVTVSLMVVIPFSIYFTLRGNVSIVKLLTIILGALALTFNASFNGRQSGDFFLWFPILGSTFSAFYAHERWKTYLSIFFCLACIFFLEWTNYNFFNHKETLPDISFNYKMQFDFFLSMGIIVMIFYFNTQFNDIQDSKVLKLSSFLNDKNRKLIKLNQELDAFVLKASHDLKAPLNSILGLNNLLKLTESKSEINKYLEFQEKTAKKMLLFISDMLSLSYNEKNENEIQEINLSELVEECLFQLAFIEDSKKIFQSIEINASCPFHSDEKRLMIIFNNILSNAVRYADFNKATSTITIHIEVNQDTGTFTFEDNGIGIERENIQRVFEMFFRSQKKMIGSGFGLYIVSETLKKLNGTIALDSEYGQWTRFTITLPNQYTTNSRVGQ